MVKDNIIMENARIGFRNFSGAEGKFNPAGRRNFCVFLDDSKLVHNLENDGWNIKYLKPREEEDESQAYLQVSVAYTNIPPKIVLVTSRGKTILDEDTIDMLDWVELKNVDIIINPYNWDVNGKSGVKAYAKSVYITIMEDVFEQKYLDVPDSAMKALPASSYNPDSIDVEFEEAF
jgi:hypothetical protein